MRISSFIVILLACLSLAGNVLAVKPPSVSERQEKISDSDQQKKAEWFGRESGKNCECGVSRLDPNKCYYPKQGQVCCNPRTGDCHMVKTTKWNVPFKD
ncbi:MAG: hypothetical protein ABH871_00480 [Pseudomonadota bacterium]